MSEERKSMFDGFEIDEETGEVLIPRASVGTVSDESKKANESEGTLSQNAEYIPAQSEEEELPELHFEFDFGEEEFANPTETVDEETILQNIDEALAAQMAVTLGPVEEVPEAKQEKKGVWHRIPMWCRIAMISLCSLCLILVLLVGTKPGQKLLFGLAAGYVDDRVGRPEDVTKTPEQNSGNEQNPVPTQSVEKPGDSTENPGQTVVPTVEPRHEEYVYNILLIGEEALPQFGGSRSDSMILVSINSRDKKIYMTSLMRDMYVEIPGYSDNKLNAAYAYGGAPLLIDTIELNLQVKVDGYVKVGFDSFEWIVDRLGGVEITLTAEEADYLRKKDYISNPAYRNVVAGTQLMNGNQVLGYCRVRFVPTANGTYSDFGRTERQRTVLKKIFDKYKDTNIFTLLSIFNDCLPRVITDISKEDMQELMETVVENRIINLEAFRIPVAGTYEDARVGGSEVLVVKWAKNIEQLHNKIFGEE